MVKRYLQEKEPKTLVEKKKKAISSITKERNINKTPFQNFLKIISVLELLRDMLSWYKL